MSGIFWNSLVKVIDCDTGCLKNQMVTQCFLAVLDCRCIHFNMFRFRCGVSFESGNDFCDVVIRDIEPIKIGIAIKYFTYIIRSLSTAIYVYIAVWWYRKKKKMLLPCAAVQYSDLHLFWSSVHSYEFQVLLAFYLLGVQFVLLAGNVSRPAALLVCAIVKLKIYSTLPLLFPGLTFGWWLVKGGTLWTDQ